MRPICIGMELGTVRLRYARVAASAVRSSIARYVPADEPRLVGDTAGSLPRSRNDVG